MARRYFKRLRSLLLLFLVLFFLLGGRLLHIQLVQGQKLEAMGNKIRSELIPGEEIPRGDILDRNKISLLDTGERDAAVIFPAIFKSKNIEALSHILQISSNKIVDEIEKSKNYYSNNPIIIKSNLTLSEVENLRKSNLDGVYIIPIKSRYGPNSLAVHLVGHLGPIDRDSWERLQNKNINVNEKTAYKNDDLIGVKGIEGIFEPYLRSVTSSYFLQATTDAHGRPLLGLGFKKIYSQDNPNNRNNVVLTIDSHVQKVVEDAMDRHINKGAVIIIKNSTGEILALASRPSFDQNKIEQYMNSATETEFLNRAILDYYPGSVFKLLIAAAALEEKIVDPKETFECRGEYRFATGLTISCWNQEGHGTLTFKETLAHSCNPIFIEVGLRLGADKIIEYAKKFKLDQNDLLGYPLQDYNSISIEGNSLAAIGNAVLGQKGVRLSPLQVAKMYATIANDGVYQTPRVVKTVESYDEKIYKKYNSGQGEPIISLDTTQQLQEMLKLATTSGTATKAWVPGWGSAGKTSTAQTGETTGIGKEKMNVWFAGFAPYENPKYTAVIMIEDGISGGKDAAPVFREIMEEICNNNI